MAPNGDAPPEETGEPPTLPLGESISDTSWPVPITGPDSDEAASLKQRLAESHREALHVNLTEFDLRQRLADAEEKIAELETQLQTRSAEVIDSATVPARLADADDSVSGAELARLKTDWRRGVKALEQENKERRSELVLIRGQLHQTRRQLDLESTARQGEAARYAATIADLEADLEETRNAAANRKRTGPRMHVARGGVAAFLAGALSLAVAIWIMFAKPSSATCATPAVASITAPASGTAGTTESSPATAPTPAQPIEAISLPGTVPADGSAVRGIPEPHPGFAGGMDRLNDALAAYPNRKPEDILREIHRKAAKTDPSLCAFDWNNGQPAIQYGGGGKLSLSATVDRCAAAIEKYR